MARVLVTGINGQIGSFLADILLEDGHDVVGLAATADEPLRAGVVRAVGGLDEGGLEHLLDRNGSLDSIVHLAARSSVAASWVDPVKAIDANGWTTCRLVFAAAKRTGLRLVHASSAEIFGCAEDVMQDESTRIEPVSPYGVSKAAAHFAVRVAREGLRAPMTNLIFYVGESERRASHFVFRKITSTVAAIARGEARELVVGDLSIVRDFCYARDLARAAALVALEAPPNDYVCASSDGRSLREIVEVACRVAGIDLQEIVRIDRTLFRPSDPRSLVGNSARLRSMGWAPTLNFEGLVRHVLEHDMRKAG